MATPHLEPPGGRGRLQKLEKDGVPALKVLNRLNRELVRRGVSNYSGYEIINHDVFVNFWVGGQKRSIHIAPSGRIVGWVPRGVHNFDRAHWLQPSERVLDATSELRRRVAS